MIELLDRFLPKNDRLRSAILTTAAVVSVLAFCAFILPGGVPLGVLINGMTEGMRTALVTAGLVLIYRSTRIVNFAQGVLGVVGAAFAFNLGVVGISGIGVLPFPLVFIISLVMSAVIGLVLELLFVRRFFNSPRLVLTVVTIVATPLLGQFGAKVDGLAFWRKGPEILKLRTEGKLPLPYKDFHFSIFPFRFGFAEILVVIACVAAFAGLAIFFKTSKMGSAIRASSENSDRALMLGINVGMLSTVVWGIAALLSGLAAILGSIDQQIGSGIKSSPEDLLPALAAAILARMVSLPIAIVSAIMLEILHNSLTWSFPDATLFDLVLFGLILGSLLLQRTRFARTGEGLASSWKATQELRPTPKELLVVPGLRRIRRLLFGIGAVALIVFPQAFSPSRVNLASLIAIYGIIALSLVILTGWGGQVSLAQFAFVGVGALVGGKLTGDLHIPFWFAIPIAGAVTAAFATAIGVPALRLRGPFLAVSTLSFATVFGKFFLDENRFGFLFADNIERPSFLFVHFASERNYYYLCLVAVGLSAIVVKRLRTGRTGRVLIALREDEYGVQPFGINAFRSRLAVFALSGTLAGLAGVLLVHHSRSVDATAYAPLASIDMFILVMVGGVTSVSGALLGAVYVGVSRFLIADEQLQRLATSGGLLYLLIASPGGLAAVAYSIRDAILRIIATRQRIVVPSLFEDVDPETIARQKTPMAPAFEGRGLEAIADMDSYVIDSELYPVKT